MLRALPARKFKLTIKSRHNNKPKTKKNYLCFVNFYEKNAKITSVYLVCIYDCYFLNPIDNNTLFENFENVQCPFVHIECFFLIFFSFICIKININLCMCKI